ncbi:DUF2938 family protein [Pelagibius marinus]|uniref:DUF2938 family protein n=1 Tax=Pelagibius marinus TaxID=2762760 RepID=UPI001872E39B|nr:DUF2938 family protein [Pelagibius marinus]
MPLDSFVFVACVSGVFATIVLDLWQRVLFVISGIPPTNWALIGRWFAHLPRGRFIHRPIGESAAVPGELALGWVMHYLVGLIYGFVYVGLMTYGFDRLPSVSNGAAFGAASVVIPWFILQPGLGIGVMGRLAPNPLVPRLNALVSHIIYGIALCAGSWLAGILVWPMGHN